jgi:hypothetical protein
VLYFYFMAALGWGNTPIELAGTVIPAPGATRHDLYRQLAEKARETLGCERKQLIVTQFSLEPNELGT